MKGCWKLFNRQIWLTVPEHTDNITTETSRHYDLSGKCNKQMSASMKHSCPKHQT